jgi:hypothetical protein
MAFRSLAFKWLRIVFRCWKDNKPYQDEIHRQALARRPQPGQKGNATVQIQWKNSAGFSKIAAS